jgi:energy-coupling factor transporter transmembrane protein EcfT
MEAYLLIGFLVFLIILLFIRLPFRFILFILFTIIFILLFLLLHLFLGRLDYLLRGRKCDFRTDHNRLTSGFGEKQSSLGLGFGLDFDTNVFLQSSS